MKENKEIQEYFQKQYQTVTTEKLEKLWVKFYNTIFNTTLSYKRAVSFEAVIWQNILTEEKVLEYLSNTRYIVQSWKNLKVYIDT